MDWRLTTLMWLITDGIWLLSKGIWLIKLLIWGLTDFHMLSQHKQARILFKTTKKLSS